MEVKLEAIMSTKFPPRNLILNGNPGSGGSRILYLGGEYIFIYIVSRIQWSWETSSPFQETKKEKRGQIVKKTKILCIEIKILKF